VPLTRKAVVQLQAEVDRAREELKLVSDALQAAIEDGTAVDLSEVLQPTLERLQAGGEVLHSLARGLPEEALRLLDRDGGPS
jgi:hypothetical protein